MNSERFARLKKLLLEASDIPEEKRKAYLDQACGDDPELRLEAESILADGAASSAILRQAGDVPEAALQPGDETPPLPSKIGQYTIKRVIASGGMGVVYEALQEKPHRTVALKVMKSGITSSSALRRFEYESQLLARLQHPGIAQVYEAGTHDDGCEPIPYFAMEYVPDARTIIDFAEEKKLGTRERLELFAQVCDAVHHGHQKGIIHRDLKPGNILVGPQGQVKVIDFGVARSTDSDMALTTLQTDVGQLIGTLQYMSPEQCAADPNDIDTRSDVYALGVVQYELLCGQLPYDVRQKAFHEVTRVIREEPPTRPSSISKQLRGDVETITLKALEKERDRRYQSAVELAQDIRRYLSGEAIIGRPPSMVYQLQIFARRHKAIFAAVATILVVLAVGLVVSTGMYFRAEQAREETTKERDRALVAEQEAEERRAEAEAVTTFLSKTLAAVDPSEAQGREVTVREMLDKASEKIDESFAEQPLVEATLRSTIGNTYHALGQYPIAELHLEIALEIKKRELGEEHLDTLTSMYNLAELNFVQSQYDEAHALLEPCLAQRRDLLGEEHPDTLETMSSLAWIRFKQGDFARATEIHGQVLETRRRMLGEEHPDTVSSMLQLARLHSKQGRCEKAETLVLKALEIRRRTLGEEHPDTMDALDELGNVYFYWGRYDKSEPIALSQLDYHRRIYGEEHPLTLECINDVAADYVGLKRYDEAEQLLKKAHEVSRHVLGEEHDSTLLYLDNLGWMYELQGRDAEAEEIYTQVLEPSRRRFGDKSFRAVAAFAKLARIYVKQGRYTEAEEILVWTAPLWKQLMPDNFAPGRSLKFYGACLLKTGRYREAETALLESQTLLKDWRGDEHIYTVDTVKLLVELYETWGKPDKAAEWGAKLPDPVPESESDRFP